MVKKYVYFLMGVVFLITLSFPAWAKDTTADQPQEKMAEIEVTEAVLATEEVIVYTQTITDAPGMGEYRWFNQDFGWTHTFDLLDVETIQWAKLSINAWDVDYDAPDGERDLVYADGQNLGALSSYNSTWSISTFPLPPSLLYDGN
ncbi:MAG: hypothetical protein ACUVRM_07505 [Bacillota bacterium]